MDNCDRLRRTFSGPLFFRNGPAVSSDIEADRAGFLWWSVVECGGVWWSVVECGGVRVNEGE